MAPTRWRAHRFGFTALTVCRNAKMAEVLLEAVEQHAPNSISDLLSARSHEGNNAMHWAFEEGVDELLNVLLAAIKKVNGDGVLALKKALFVARGRDKDTVLLKVCKSDDDKCMLVLGAMFDGADPDAFNEMRKVLLLRDIDGCTAVHLAGTCGFETSLRKMLEVLTAVKDGTCEKALGVKDRNGKRTPLHGAAEKGTLSCVQMLLEYGAELGEKDERRDTPLMMAEREKHLEVARVLREVRSAGASAKEE
ncbi:hypothetical protein HDU96_000306 [Phlyctochytrium bullatum]|nr:hypothetical protein HDU96_000306 [Phlyctochytrium bullatum]